MTIEERVDKIEAALGKNDALVIQLRDAVTVTLGLEEKHGRMMKDHAEWLIGHDQAMIEFREQAARRREEHDRAMNEIREQAARRQEEHDRAMNEFREQAKAQAKLLEASDARRREESKALDERIANLVSGFGEFMRRERKA